MAISIFCSLHEQTFRPRTAQDKVVDQDGGMGGILIAVGQMGIPYYQVGSLHAGDGLRHVWCLQPGLQPFRPGRIDYTSSLYSFSGNHDPPARFRQQLPEAVFGTCRAAVIFLMPPRRRPKRPTRQSQARQRDPNH